MTASSPPSDNPSTRPVRVLVVDSSTAVADVAMLRRVKDLLEREGMEVVGSEVGAAMARVDAIERAALVEPLICKPVDEELAFRKRGGRNYTSVFARPRGRPRR